MNLTTTRIVLRARTLTEILDLACTVVTRGAFRPMLWALVVIDALLAGVAAGVVDTAELGTATPVAAGAAAAPVAAGATAATTASPDARGWWHNELRLVTAADHGSGGDEDPRQQAFPKIHAQPSVSQPDAP